MRIRALFPVDLRWTVALVMGLGGCAALQPQSPSAKAPTPSQLATLGGFDAVLIGEQHDAAEHQRIARDVVAALAAEGTLAAVAMEMAEQGRGTQALKPGASEAQVRQALDWNDKAWPWADYGPVAMAAVRAGVPVLGANLPRERMKDAMADVSLDVQLPGPALKAQQQAIRMGHCNLLPESQILPMTRIQIARDRAMARTVAQAAVPGKRVLLVSGAAHADRSLGVPQHLPTDLKVRVVKLQAGDAQNDRAGRFDSVWTTPSLPEKDYCAGVSMPSSRN